MEERLKLLSGTFSSSRFSTQDPLALGDSPLNVGDWLEIYTFGSWIPGRVGVDAAGWYLLTPDQINICLRAGLRARLRQGAPGCLPPAGGFQQFHEG